MYYVIYYAIGMLKIKFIPIGKYLKNIGSTTNLYISFYLISAVYDSCIA